MSDKPLRTIVIGEIQPRKHFFWPSIVLEFFALQINKRKIHGTFEWREKNLATFSFGASQSTTKEYMNTIVEKKILVFPGNIVA